MVNININKKESFRRKSEKVLSLGLPNDVAHQIAHVGQSVDLKDYSVPISKFEKYYVSPHEIESVTGREWKPWLNRRTLIGTVKAGNWDITSPERPEKKLTYAKDYNNSDFHRACTQRYENDICWKDTEFYQKRVEIGRSKTKTLAAVKKFDSLLNEIRENGYLTQDELGNYQNDMTGKYVNEVLVDLSRDGEFLFVDGRHRLSVAKILDLDRIPVSVLVRHKKWLEKLEYIDVNNVNKQVIQGINRSHPEIVRCLNREK